MYITFMKIKFIFCFEMQISKLWWKQSKLLITIQHNSNDTLVIIQCANSEPYVAWIKTVPHLLNQGENHVN